MIAAPCSTVLYRNYGPKVAISIMAMLPMMMVPLIYNLRETKNIPVSATKVQCMEIWNTVRSRAVWQPMGFVSFDTVQEMKLQLNVYGFNPFIYIYFFLTNFHL